MPPLDAAASAGSGSQNTRPQLQQERIVASGIRANRQPSTAPHAGQPATARLAAGLCWLISPVSGMLVSCGPETARNYGQGPGDFTVNGVQTTRTPWFPLRSSASLAVGPS